MKISEIRALLAKVDPLEVADCECLTEGSLSARDGRTKPYKLLLGWNIGLTNRCDDTWGTFTIQLFRFIKAQNYSDEQRKAVLSAIQCDDSHWRWLEKSLLNQGDEYKWFFLMAEGEPQAACLIFHPKPSAFDGQGVFYIEYVAVAPWNRKNPMAEQVFVGLGTLMVREASHYAVKTLGLRPGFSLHALPRAAGFYDSIGMSRFPALDKDSMPYFEMPANCAFLQEKAA
ncbi:hypothetical protein PEC18_07545 [Paucibacter sp. O1-1]|nr:hypothetical protein [Paucibacter sp. O1-1]MDA3825725.1 hypothetical protein [Paucibacter sp. O1-1]